MPHWPPSWYTHFSRSSKIKEKPKLKPQAVDLSSQIQECHEGTQYRRLLIFQGQRRLLSDDPTMAAILDEVPTHVPSWKDFPVTDGRPLSRKTNAMTHSVPLWPTARRYRPRSMRPQQTPPRCGSLRTHPGIRTLRLLPLWRKPKMAVVAEKITTWMRQPSPPKWSSGRFKSV